MILGNEFKRYNGRFNLDSEINDKIRFGTTLIRRGDVIQTNENENSLGGALRATMDWYTKFAPIYNTDGSYAFAPPSIHHGPFSGNRMAESDAVNFNRITNRFLGNAFIEFDVIEGLTVQARGGVNYTGESHYLFHKLYQFSIGLIQRIVLTFQQTEDLTEVTLRILRQPVF